MKRDGCVGTMLAELNNTTVAYPRNRCIHELFAEHAIAKPDAIAIVCDGKALTYGELERRSNRLAHYLQKLGAKPEVPVGLCFERSLDMIVVLLAVLKAGAAYLPLDPGYPKQRLGYMLQDSGAHLVLAGASTAAALTDLPAKIVVVDEGCFAGQPSHAPASRAAAENLAYLMYTSGSTGPPKAVGVVHYNITRLVRGANYVDIGAKDVFLQLAPLAFDASTFEIWGALLNGAKLVLYPDPILDLAKLGRLIADEGVTIVWLTAGLFNRVVDESLSLLAPLKQLLAGGDVLSFSHVKKVLQALPCRMINGYGPTECTTFSVCFRIPDAAAIENIVPIGRPISNAQAYILDENLDPVEPGRVGELYIGGDGLARGYYRRPGLTAERFVANPFGLPGTRLYRTGDLVRLSRRGLIEFVGRVDRQLKVRGYRVEPGEIEAAVLSFEGIRQAVIVASLDSFGDKRLVAYIVGESGAVPEAVGLRAALREKLPEHMIPSAFVFLDEFKLTPNGKIDRDALPAPDWRPPPKNKRGLPRTPVEKAIAVIWSEILGVENISIHDDFFALGGTSERFSAAAARIRERFGVPIGPQSTTLAAVVNYVRRNGTGTL
jgi:amino acid adenylation domain-containing protein